MANRRTELAWLRLHLAPPLSVDQAVAILRALATLHGAPRLVLEATGTSGDVRWAVSSDPATLRRVAELLPTHLPDAQPLRQLGGERPGITRAVQLIVRGQHRRQLAVERAETVNRALIAGLASTRPGETVVLQMVLGRRLRPVMPIQRGAAAGQAEHRRLRAAKTAEHGFGCAVRIGVGGAEVARSRQLVGTLLAALRAIEVAGIAISLRRCSAVAVRQASSPWRWSLRLSVREVACFVGWPLGEPPLAGLPPQHPRLLQASDSVARRGRIVGDSLAPGQSRPLALTVADSLRHCHILGPTGVGKSVLAGNLAVSDMAAGRSLVVIDPKGDLVQGLLARVPPHRIGDVAVLDATDLTPIGLNPLAGDQPDVAADAVLSVFADLYAGSWGPRTQDILHACLLSLARRGDASLVLVPLLLTNAGLRRSVVGRVARHDPMGLGSFWSWYEAISEAERQAAIAPLMNKLRPVLLRPGLRAVLGQVNPRFDIRDVFTRRRILLVSLARGQLGPAGARLLGGLVCAQLWQAATERADVPAQRRHPVMVYIDEVQDYLRLPGDLEDALVQARGLGVGFTMAHQHLAQLPPPLRAAVLANVGSRVCFRLNHDDAAVMARGQRLAQQDFMALGRYQAYASLLADGDPAGFASLTTRPQPPAVSDPAVVRLRSRERYGRPLSEVEAAWASLAVPAPSEGSLGRRRREAAS